MSHDSLSPGSNRRRCGFLVAALTIVALLVFLPGVARGSSVSARPQIGAAPMVYSANVSAPSSSPPARKQTKSNGNCSVGQLLLNALNPLSNCQPLNQAAQAIAGLPGTVAKAAATGIMDQVTAWMVGAAQTISGWVVKEAGAITKPELDASWYLNLFSGLAALGGALAGLVALIALGSAAIRKDPDALGEVIYGIGRAGIGTSVVVALTIIALTAADGISNEFARQMPAAFYKALATQWGGSGWGGFGAAALAFLVAFVATIAGLVVWLELIVREAAIYLAVLFFPVALAASIWPALRMWVRRLSMLLLMFVMLRPVVVIVLALAGSVTSAGLSFGNGSIPHSVGTILAGVVIFALAGFTPWALMFLLGTEVGTMNTRTAASRAGRSSASGSSGGRVGGALSGGQLALAGGGGLAAGGEGGGDQEGPGAESGRRGLRLPSLGGSGNGAASAVAGPVAAAAGWMGGVAGAVGRTGGHIAARGRADPRRLRARRGCSRRGAAAIRRRARRTRRRRIRPPRLWVLLQRRAAARGLSFPTRHGLGRTTAVERNRPGLAAAARHPTTDGPTTSVQLFDGEHAGQRATPSGRRRRSARSTRGLQIVSAEIRYRFGPHPHGGFMLGFRLPQLFGFVLAGVIGLGLLSLGGFVAIALIAFDAILTVIALVVSVHGHTLEEWTPLCLRFLIAHVNGRHRFRSAQPAIGHVTSIPGEPRLDPQPVEAPVSLPGEIAELELLEGALPHHHEAVFGAVKDTRAHTYTATLMCQSSAFYLLSSADREARLAAYGAVLAALARDHAATRRIAWYERTLPPGSDRLADYLHEAKRPDADMGDPPIELVSYLELLAGQGDGSEDHEVLVSVQIDAGRPAAGRAIRDLGGGDEGAMHVLGDELELVAQRLTQAGVVVAGVLNRRGLAAGIRNGYDPFGRHLRDYGQHSGQSGGIAAHTAAPLARDTHWSHVVCDSSLHTTLWIAEWPRIDVRATFLEELLMHTNATRTVALVMELLGPATGMRKAERAATEAGAERALRARIGKRTSARERQRESAVTSREEELASGHAAVRFAGYVTVSVPNTGPNAFSELGMIVRKVEMAANSRQLRLERMWGQQDDALTYTLPLCRGLA